MLSIAFGNKEKGAHEHDLTGRKRERGTLIPMALSKCCTVSGLHRSLHARGNEP